MKRERLRGRALALSVHQYDRLPRIPTGKTASAFESEAWKWIPHLLVTLDAT